MTAKNALLKLHLYLGLASGLFLVILGFTGSAMVFGADIDHWLHPDLWYVTIGAQTLPEEQLIRMVEQRFAPGRVDLIQMPRRSNLAQVMCLLRPGGKPDFFPRGGEQVFVNPYDGTILGHRIGVQTDEKVLAYIHRLHVSLAAGRTGALINDIAALILLIEVPLGIYLWWRSKRASIKWNAPWFRICFDLHNVLGIYAAIFLFVAALTGVLIGFDRYVEPAVYRLMHSPRATYTVASRKSTPVAGATPISIDRSMEIARQALPNAEVDSVQVPVSPAASWSVRMRVPEETSESVHSGVDVDQYTGQVLRVQNFSTDSPGYRVIRFNRSLHMGDIFGLPYQIVTAVSSLLLMVIAITGIVIWWKKLAI